MLAPVPVCREAVAANAPVCLHVANSIKSPEGLLNVSGSPTERPAEDVLAVARALAKLRARMDHEAELANHQSLT
jgi:hypothetical protein